MKQLSLVIIFILSLSFPTYSKQITVSISFPSVSTTATTVESLGVGGFLVAGNKGDSSYIAKISISGSILWLKTYKFGSTSLGDRVFCLEVEPDGSIWGAGCTYTDYVGFYFRLDSMGTPIWVRSEPQTASQLMGFDLKYWNNEMYLSYNSYNSTSYSLRKINKYTGLPITATPFYYNNLSIATNGLFLKNIGANIVVFGRTNSTTGYFEAVQDVFTPSLQLVSSTKTNFSSSSSSAFTYTDCAISPLQDSAVFCIWSDLSASGAYNFALSRSSLTNGGIGWSKFYNSPNYSSILARNIQQIPDGYLVYGYSSGSTKDVVLMKTDFEGNAIFMKKYNSGFDDFIFNNSPSSMVSQNGKIFLIGSAGTISGTTNAFFIELDSTYSNPCFQFLPVPISTSIFSQPTVSNNSYLSLPTISSPALKQQTYGDSYNKPYCPTNLLTFKDTIICGDSVFNYNYVNLSGVSLLWSNGQTNTTFSTTQSGTYWVRGTGLCCLLTDTFRVRINGKWPLLQSETFCDSTWAKTINLRSYNLDSVRWSDGDTSTLKTFRNPGGVFSITLYKNGCTKQDTVRFRTALMPKISLVSDTSNCTGQPMLFRIHGTFERILWSTGDTSRVLSLSTAGSYWYIVSNSTCSVSDTFNIFNPASFPKLANQSYCDSTTFSYTINLTSINSDSLLWSDGDTSRIKTFKHPGKTYYLTFYSGGCVKTDSISISQLPLPLDSLFPDIEICTGTEFKATPYGNYSSILWSTGATTRTLPISAPGTYTYTVTLGNCTQIDTFSVSLSIPVDRFSPPTLITPNNDGINDEWDPSSKGVSVREIWVFNRWGQLVFHSTNPTDTWKPKENDLVEPEGIYKWIVSYSVDCGQNQLENQSGLLKIIR